MFENTIVTYPGARVSEKTDVLKSGPYGEGKAYVLIERCPFYPVNYRWPDQPSDTGTLKTDSGEYEVEKAIVCATQDGEEIFFEGDIPAKRGEEGWTYIAALIIEGAPLSTGVKVLAEVDLEQRNSHSSWHSVCHLASLALNKALKGYWRKEVMLDPVGHPDFDRLAIETSKINIDGTYDAYRIGKSLRKKGFNAQDCYDNLKKISAETEAIYHSWIKDDQAINITPTEGDYSSTRLWTCNLDGIQAEIPCGGTHVKSTSELPAIKVDLAAEPDEGRLIMTCSATPT